MTDEEIKDAILNGDPSVIEECEVEIETPLKISRIYRIKGGITARYTHIPLAVYPRGVALNAMPKDQIELIEPEQLVIYRTDWTD